jgi:UDP-N-acetylmuramoyl-L-alanyl-D-glutamate--2,6-diaminopimelate ligase
MNSIRNTIKLKKLIDGLDIKIAKGSKDIDIAGLSSNSKQVAPGFLYIAIRGKAQDGNQYVTDAIQAGAVSILSDLYNPFLEGVTQLITPNTKALEAVLASRFYENPHEKLFLIGITGTSGKTTISYLVKHLLKDCGLIGGVESIIGEHRIKSDLTTPDCITCYKLLKEMTALKIPSAVMEVTSHALSQNRVDGIFYDIALFTNLTQEHLDYHDDMSSYAAEKAKLFSKLKKDGIAILNIDDPWSGLMKTQNKVVTYSIKQEADFSAKEIVMNLNGTQFTLSCFGKEEVIKVPLIGRFNVYNVLGAIAVAYMKGIPLNEIKKRLLNFGPVPGRMQPVSCKEGSYVFVDFAHKTDALKNVLETLQELKKGKIITIFGCGGNRDREKRPEMAKVAEMYSDIVIVTTDNPRKEDPEEIIREIQKGFQKKMYLIESDRRKAIEKGLSFLNKGDTLLIAGKGHETNQIFAERSIFFDDARVAEELANTVS